MRERSAGTAMAVVGTRSGDGSFVTKRTRTWRDGSATMAGAEKVFACSNGAGFGRTFRVLPDNDARSMYIPTVLSVRRELVRPSTAVLALACGCIFFMDAREALQQLTKRSANKT
jgi:hypothetical protein